MRIFVAFANKDNLIQNFWVITLFGGNLAHITSSGTQSIDEKIVTLLTFVLFKEPVLLIHEKVNGILKSMFTGNLKNTTTNT